MKTGCCLLAAALIGLYDGQAALIYSTIPTTLPPNVDSLSYQGAHIDEFGDYIDFGSSGKSLGSVQVTMSSWTLHSDFQTYDPSYYIHPITLNIYEVNTANPSDPQPGAVLATQTSDFQIPWRPEISAYNGLAFNISFDFESLGVVLPKEIMFGITFNTQDYGYSPLNQVGPYNSLNLGVTQDIPSVGTDVDRDGFLIRDPAGGPDYVVSPGWEYPVMIQFSEPVNISPVPEPGTWMAGLALFAACAIHHFRRTLTASRAS